MAISLPDARQLSDDSPSSAPPARPARLRIGLHRSRRRGPARRLPRDRLPLVVGLRRRRDSTPCRRSGPDAPSARAACSPTSRPATSSDSSTRTAPKTWASPRPAVEPPRRPRPDPQGVRHRPGRADRGRVPQALGLHGQEAAPPRREAGPRGSAAVAGGDLPGHREAGRGGGRGDLLVRRDRGGGRRAPRLRLRPGRAAGDDGSAGPAHPHEPDLGDQQPRERSAS